MVKSDRLLGITKKDEFGKRQKLTAQVRFKRVERDESSVLSLYREITLTEPKEPTTAAAGKAKGESEINNKNL